MELPREEDLAAIREALEKVREGCRGLEPNEVPEEKSFTYDFGVYSLSMDELVLALKEEFRVQVPDAEVQDLQTVGDTADYVLDQNAVE